MRAALLAPALLLALLAGCADDAPADAVDAEALAEDAARAATDAIDGVDLDGATLSTEAPRDVVDVVTTADGTVEIGVAGDALFTRLSEATRREVEAEMEREAEGEEGLGGTIARAITGAVAEGLAATVRVPLADVADIRWDGDRLVVEMADGGPSPLDEAKVDDRPLLESLDEAAGRRLVDAFEKATGR